MIGMPSYSRINCTLVGGPKDGVATSLACLDSDGAVPCNTKEFMIDRDGPNPYIAVYRLRWTSPETWETDETGRAVLYWEGKKVDDA